MNSNTGDCYLFTEGLLIEKLNCNLISNRAKTLIRDFCFSTEFTSEKSAQYNSTHHRGKHSKAGRPFRSNFYKDKPEKMGLSFSIEPNSSRDLRSDPAPLQQQAIIRKIENVERNVIVQIRILLTRMARRDKVFRLAERFKVIDQDHGPKGSQH